MLHLLNGEITSLLLHLKSSQFLSPTFYNNIFLTFQFFYDNSLKIVPILVLTGILIYFIYRKFANSKLNVKTDYSEFEPKEQQYNLYFLFFGILLPVMELINETFHVRNKSLLLVNCVIGIIFIGIYFLATKTKLITKSINAIFIGCFTWSLEASEKTIGRRIQ